MHIKNIAGGSYLHIGIVTSITARLTQFAKDFHSETVKLQINTGGVPLFRSSNVALWPILGKIKEIANCVPFVIGLFSGKTKLGSVNEFLTDFVDEMSKVEVDGIIFNSKHYPVSLDSVICDAPSRAFVKCIKGHTGYSVCERCTQNGVYRQNQISFPECEAGKRRDDR
ncbi:hypothetical protein BSL78_07951 [Apostichopus japonicus]|uniref:Uncharacterized protein n=1 Tax=Stichopus japonicus TaxID=307972 RepID=A0A2G8L4P7_STIJA|nr:hypothetical protein BSL78_07951 [Apostichopus japonicus]